MTPILPLLAAAASLALASGPANAVPKGAPDARPPASTASGPGTLGSTDFSYTGAARLRALPAEGVPAPGPIVSFSAALPAVGRITDLGLLAQTGRKNLYSYNDTREQHDAFLVMWAPILSAAGFTPGQPTREHSLSVLPYEGGDDLVVREFLAEPLQFKPKDEPDRLANLAMVAGAARDAGFPVIANYLVDHPYLLPTYALYYVTHGADKLEREVQVRVLKKEGVDPAVLERAGLKVLQSKDDFVTVYIGQEVGMVYRAADELPDLQLKIDEFKKFIAGQGGRFLEAKVTALPPGSWRKYVADLYFFF
ncbi:MAG: hypothetical protein HY927_13975 [Elusimicrobia bacterium]|nr:hypothetical protein [Elusimicrobiota bacterium]